MGYKYFSDDELRCQCGCGVLNPNPEFDVLMQIMDKIREEYGKPLRVTSGYRCANHPIEKKKAKPGQHNVAAIDLGVSRKDAVRLLRIAMSYQSIRGIGVQQKGDARFLHFDMRTEPTIWSY